MDSADDDVRRRVLQQWTTSGSRREGKIGIEDVVVFEQRYRTSLPPVLKTLLLAADGMESGKYDNQFIRFWQLSEIRPAATELGSKPSVHLKDYFLFADYSISAHFYAVRLSEAAPNDVVLVGGDHIIQVAESFASFLAMYVSQPKLLFPSAASSADS
jgi:hypothetical protein